MKPFVIETPRGYKVACTEKSWEHIVTHGHSMMQENEEAIKDALADPICVFKSAEHPEKREVFFGRSEKATYGTKFVTKVVVEKPNEYNDMGEVVSTWPQRHTDGGYLIAF